jgi:phosphate transport system substrate-binding protein
MRNVTLAIVALLYATLTIPSATAADVISGAGSSAAAPVYRGWAAAYGATSGASLKYDPAGSSAGLAKIREHAVDFGASDVAPSEQELAKDGLVAIPTVVTAVVPVLNLPKVAGNQVRLTGAVLAKIFLGTITQWSDPELRALNPSLTLPALPIKVVVRADGSGTTNHFSRYLAKASPEWSSKRGVKSTFEWPAGFVAVRGSDGVVKAVQDTTGAIGYVDFNYAVDHQLSAAQMRNASGEFVSVSAAAIREAVVASDWNGNGDFRASLADLPGSGVWPITMGTYVLFPQQSKSPDATLRAMRLVTWALQRGDYLAKELKFVPLPERVQAKAFRVMASVTDDQGVSIGMRALNPAL